MSELFITKELLEEKGACEDGINYFARMFPQGCEMTDENIMKFKDCDPEFVWWFYNHVQQDTRLYALCGVNGSDGVNDSCGVNGSNGVNRSYGVNSAYGINGSNGVNNSFGVLNCAGVNQTLFSMNIRSNPVLFGVVINEEYFEEVKGTLDGLLQGWRPTFNNLKSLWLKAGSDWKLTPVKNARELSIKEAWEGMPQAAIDYVRSLPEFDAEMFEKITGIVCDKEVAQ